MPRIGVVLAAQEVASVPVLPLASAWGDRLGRRMFIAIGVVLSAAVLAAIPHVSGLVPFLVLALLFGAGTGLVTPSTTALIGDRLKRGAYGAAMGVFGSLWDIGHTAGALLVGSLVTRLGYGEAFVVLTVLMPMALAWFLVDRPIAKPDRCMHKAMLDHAVATTHSPGRRTKT